MSGRVSLSLGVIRAASFESLGGYGRIIWVGSVFQGLVSGTNIAGVRSGAPRQLM